MNAAPLVHARVETTGAHGGGGQILVRQSRSSRVPVVESPAARKGDDLAAAGQLDGAR
jgi:hypothetical protein